MKRKIFLIFCLGIVLAVFFADRLVGALLESRLSGTLTRLFGMPVSISGLRADLFSGWVRADAIKFMNQPEFTARPHLITQGIIFRIDFPALKKKKVLIKTVILVRPVYLIERAMFETEKRANVVTWVRHIKGRKKTAPASGPVSPAPSSPESRWEVDIQKIVIRDGTFIYHDTSEPGEEGPLVFEKLEGSLQGFHWPAPEPLQLTQKVSLKGEFGSPYPSPFYIRGDANFATGQVSFDLKAHVEDGDVRGQRRWWRGLPIDITEGRFQLECRAVCDRRELKSRSRLILRSIKVTTGKSATDKLWGIPMTGVLGFLQEQKAIELKIPVSGNIRDPQFDLTYAFREAFQKSLRRKTQQGVNFLAEGTANLARQTADMVGQTGGKVAGSLEKMIGLSREKAPKE